MFLDQDGEKGDVGEAAPECLSCEGVVDREGESAVQGGPLDARGALETEAAAAVQDVVLGPAEAASQGGEVDALGIGLAEELVLVWLPGSDSEHEVILTGRGGWVKGNARLSPDFRDVLAAPPADAGDLVEVVLTPHFGLP